MPRPSKCRRVEFLPGVTYFKPAGIPLRDLEEVRVSVEEAEAIRLKDLSGLEQGQAAERMNISRPTFQRVLASARQKIAGALLNGKAIRIEGGNFKIAWQRFQCRNGHEWDVPFEEAAVEAPELCPTCKSTSVLPVRQNAYGGGRQGSGGYRKGKFGRRPYAGERTSSPAGSYQYQRR